GGEHLGLVAAVDVGHGQRDDLGTFRSVRVDRGLERALLADRRVVRAVAPVDRAGHARRAGGEPGDLDLGARLHDREIGLEALGDGRVCPIELLGREDPVGQRAFVARSPAGRDEHVIAGLENHLQLGATSRRLVVVEVDEVRVRLGRVERVGVQDYEAVVVLLALDRVHAGIVRCELEGVIADGAERVRLRRARPVPRGPVDGGVRVLDRARWRWRRRRWSARDVRREAYGIAVARGNGLGSGEVYAGLTEYDFGPFDHAVERVHEPIGSGGHERMLDDLLLVLEDVVERAGQRLYDSDELEAVEDLFNDQVGAVVSDAGIPQRGGGARQPLPEDAAAFASRGEADDDGHAERRMIGSIHHEHRHAAVAREARIRHRVPVTAKQ